MVTHAFRAVVVLLIQCYYMLIIGGAYTGDT